LLARDAVLGGVWLTRSARAPVFSAGDAKLLAALATQAAAFLDNARLHQRALAQERMQHELQLAYEVQARLMPRALPDQEGWDLAGFWRPAREVSGDFYDLLRVGEAMGVVVADVADKGMPAALFMAVTRSLLRAGAGPGRTPAQVIATVNRLASLDAADGMFVTLWYGELRPDGTVLYVNAGHNPPLLVRADGRVERLPRTGILVGWDGDAEFGQATVALEPHDLLVAFTDGVTEARDPAGEEFGEARLLEVVLAHRGATAAALLEVIRGALDDFVADAPTHDDCTLVVARRRAPTR
jgi:phosphoserine phosphatase RsbU/P